ncbi:hypothetical protein Q3C01_36455 [Bradyrhizobium sp. UFLA05-109]
MGTKNIIALIVIAIVIVGGAVALRYVDTGQGARTSPGISAKTASD